MAIGTTVTCTDLSSIAIGYTATCTKTIEKKTMYPLTPSMEETTITIAKKYNALCIWKTYREFSKITQHIPKEEIAYGKYVWDCVKKLKKYKVDNNVWFVTLEWCPGASPEMCLYKTEERVEKYLTFSDPFVRKVARHLVFPKSLRKRIWK